MKVTVTVQAFFHDIKNDTKHLHAKRETKYGLSLESSGMYAV
jgi:hypothetical protein